MNSLAPGSREVVRDRLSAQGSAQTAEGMTPYMDVFENQHLNQILQAEVEAGNAVAEQSAWPPKCNTLVILKSKFKNQHPIESSELIFRIINDRHYWYAEYSTEDGSECLACGF